MNHVSEAFEREVSEGNRYRFGRNWARFLELLDTERVASAEASLRTMLQVDSLEGKTFLDVGSGSGLFSLAARRLGASVTSFDFDPDSVACTEGLRARFFPDDDRWKVTRGSILDERFVERLPPHDIVYSWGVLHHTGRMLDAIALTQSRVSPGGLLFLALYRRTWFCPLWRVEKRLYVGSPPWVQATLRATYGATIGLAHRVKHRGEPLPRGMEYETDVDDWLGGYPYESIAPRELKRLLARSRFDLVRQIVKTEGVHFTPGCDEYLFRRQP
jgi:2-polyprenyl-6-hydroxyphenyl methylase/3-demethylubiquinone-9 3-methyltransferase